MQAMEAMEAMDQEDYQSGGLVWCVELSCPSSKLSCNLSSSWMAFVWGPSEHQFPYVRCIGTPDMWPALSNKRYIIQSMRQITYPICTPLRVVSDVCMQSAHIHISFCQTENHVNFIVVYGKRADPESSTSAEVERTVESCSCLWIKSCPYLLIHKEYIFSHSPVPGATSFHAYASQACAFPCCTYSDTCTGGLWEIPCS